MSRIIFLRHAVERIMEVIYIAQETGESVRHMLYEHFADSQDMLDLADDILSGKFAVIVKTV